MHLELSRTNCYGKQMHCSKCHSFHLMIAKILVPFEQVNAFLALMEFCRIVIVLLPNQRVFLVSPLIFILLYHVYTIWGNASFDCCGIKENVHKDLVAIYFCDTKKVFTKKKICVTKNIVKKNFLDNKRFWDKLNL